jgi:hypothetical protein
MMIIGRDFHTRYQQIAMVDEATGEPVERRWVPHPFACFAKGACVSFHSVAGPSRASQKCSPQVAT